MSKYRSFSGLHGALTLNEPPAKMYLLGFNGGDEGPVYWHWIAGLGTRAAVNRWVISDAQNIVPGKPKFRRAIVVDGQRVKIWRFPPHPAGAQFGGHEVAIAQTHSGELFAVASIHGAMGEASARMAVALSRRAER